MLMAAALWLIAQAAGAQDYEVKCPSFNSPEADFSGVFFGNDLIFCSNRSKMNLSFDDDSLTLYYTDLYQAKARYDGTFSSPEPIKSINTLFNEGHATISSDGKKMYYTANLKRSVSNKLEKTDEYKLGIFEAEFINGNWVSKGEFPFNAPNAKYSVAHPALSSNDSVLYFCSNMPGGEGKSDIYKCLWQDGKWSEPINLGSKVNSKGNEFFPFINEFDVLYFSTDSRNDSEGMDIYYVIRDDEGEYEKPVRLNNTINSPYDDFAYQEKRGVNMGCFSSNRNGEQDDLFIFNKYYNSFLDCHENYSANFCYHFLDEELAALDSLPIRYEWNLGDGTILTGDSIDYCYKDYGVFTVTLNAIDTLSRMVFRKISETEITISKQDKPFIITHDTVFATVPFEGKIEYFTFDEFEIKEVKWELSDGTKYEGESFMHTFAEPGYHQIKCGIAGKTNRNGIVPMICVYKNILVENPAPETEQKPLLCCDKREYTKISLRQPVLTTNIQSKQIKKIFKLVIAESKQQLKADDELLTRIDAEIVEIKTDSSYQYAIEEANSWQELLPVYQSLHEAGYTKMYTEEYTRAELASTITKIIPRNPNNAIKLKTRNNASLAKADHIHAPENRASSTSNVNESNTDYLTHQESDSTAEKTLWVNPNRSGSPVTADRTSPVNRANETPSVVQDYLTQREQNDTTENTLWVNPNNIGLNTSGNHTLPVNITDNNSSDETYYAKQHQQSVTADKTTWVNPNNTGLKTASDSTLPVPPSRQSSTELTNTSIHRPVNNASGQLSQLDSNDLKNQSGGSTTRDNNGLNKQPSQIEIQPSATTNSANEMTQLQQVSTADGSNGTHTEYIGQEIALANAINNHSAEAHSALPPKVMYRIALFSSQERVPFNDRRFSTIKSPITETRTDNGYQYSVMAVPQKSDLTQLLSEVKAAGFNDAVIESFDTEMVSSVTLRTGRYIEPGNAKRLNIEFSKLSDIKFEYNSAEISQDSYKNLNYIAAMLLLEEDFTLKVSAHTCAIGGKDFNQKLSEERAQAVVNYFAAKGIDKSRLIATGYGLTKPIQSNESEMGRAANRRVEFIVVFQTETK